MHMSGPLIPMHFPHHMLGIDGPSHGQKPRKLWSVVGFIGFPVFSVSDLKPNLESRTHTSSSGDGRGTSLDMPWLDSVPVPLSLAPGLLDMLLSVSIGEVHIRSVVSCFELVDPV